MTVPTLLLWLLTAGALSASIFALAVAFRTSDPSLSRRLSALSTSLKEAEASLDELSAQLRAMRQREAMRAYRLRKRGDSPEDSEDEPSSPKRGDSRDWVREMNEKLALARVGGRK